MNSLYCTVLCCSWLERRISSLISVGGLVTPSYMYFRVSLIVCSTSKYSLKLIKKEWLIVDIQFKNIYCKDNLNNFWQLILKVLSHEVASLQCVPVTGHLMCRVCFLCNLTLQLVTWIQISLSLWQKMLHNIQSPRRMCMCDMSLRQLCKWSSCNIAIWCHLDWLLVTATCRSVKLCCVSCMWFFHRDMLHWQVVVTRCLVWQDLTSLRYQNT